MQSWIHVIEWRATARSGVTALIDDRGGTAFAASTQLTYGPTGRFRAGTTAVVRIRFENWLTPGRYRRMSP